MEHSIRQVHLGEHIKRLRFERGLTAAQLANRAGVTENAIRKIESGNSKEPRFTTGLRIAQALAVEPAAIAGVPRLSGTLSGAPELARIIQALRSCQKELGREGVDHVSIFGSVARGDALAQSDVDIIVDPIPEVPFTVLNVVGAREVIQQVLGRKADVLTRGAIRNMRLAEQIEAEEVRAF